MVFSLLYAIICLVFILKFFDVLTKGNCKSNKCLMGKTAVITGGNSGLGYQCALNLASRGCRIIIATRQSAVNSERIVKRIIEETGNTNVTYKHIDLASFASVRQFAASLRDEEKRLDILINNAGCGGWQTKSDDGIYKVLQTNHLGHFLLTHLLAPLLIETKNSRIVFVCSMMAFTNNLRIGETINRLSKGRWSYLDRILDYGNSKLAMLAACDTFAERLKKHGVLVSSCHPGLIKSGFFTTADGNYAQGDFATRVCFRVLYCLVQIFGKPTFEGIQSTLHCALSSRVQPGHYVVECDNFPKPRTLDESLRRQIWAESLTLASVTKEEEGC